tara:strand:- start:1952 stop:3613 length:1662 start_codon:yes stop_codon:yes gene_type:complete
MNKLILNTSLIKLIEDAKNIKETNTGKLLLNAHKGFVGEQTILFGDEMPNYLNISNDELGKISYATNRKIQHYSWETEEDIFGSHTHRTKAKVGKTLKKIFCSTLLEANEVTPNDIETFVNQLKSLSGDSEGRFNSVTIVDDYNYYLEENTSEFAQEGNGSLGESCMRYSSCVEDNYFDMYENNCSMLINKDDDGLLDMRALLWETTCGVKIMDRIYTDEQHKEELFKLWASKNGYIYKQQQSYSQKTNFISNGVKLENKTYLIKTDAYSAELCDDYNRFPYMDTFTYAFRNDEDGHWYLTNNPVGVAKKFGVEEFRKFESTDGDYGFHSIYKVHSVTLDENKKLILNEIYSNSDYIERQYSTSLFHKGSVLFDLFKNESGELKLSRESFLSEERGKYDRIIRSGGFNSNVAYCLESETFYCSSEGTSYFKSVKKITTWDEDICAEKNTMKDFEGRIIKKSKAKVVYIEGRGVVVDKNFMSTTTTFDGVDRPRTECVELKSFGSWQYFSKVVHKKEIDFCNLVNVKSNEKLNFRRDTTLTQISEGNFDKRRKI